MSLLFLATLTSIQQILTRIKHQILFGKFLGPHFRCRFGVMRSRTEERTEYHGNAYPKLGGEISLERCLEAMV